MDFIPSKIEVTNLQPSCNKYTFDNFQFSTGYAIVLDLDADIKIYINDNCIFDCPMIPILELYLQFKKWVDNSIINNFSYQSLESTIEIFKIEKNSDKWYFISDFFEEEVRIVVDMDSFKTAVYMFLDYLEKQIKNRFNVDVLTLLKPFL